MTSRGRQVRDAAPATTASRPVVGAVRSGAGSRIARTSRLSNGKNATDTITIAHPANAGTKPTTGSSGPAARYPQGIGMV